MSKPKTRNEVCAGGVVVRDAGGVLEVALAEERDRLTGAHNTRLAKGHVESGETPEAAALREVREEIGIEARIVAPLGSVKYTYDDRGKRVHKEVFFYLMNGENHDPFPLDGEMKRMYWCEIGEAARRLTFDTEQRVVLRAMEHLHAQARD